MERTMEGLREKLFQQIDSLEKDKVSLSRAREIRNLAHVLLESVSVEIKFHKYVSDARDKKDRVGLSNIKLVK